MGEFSLLCKRESWKRSFSMPGTRSEMPGRAAVENGVPDVPDGMVQFIDGVVDLAGPAVIADQPQRGLEIQSRGEDPADHDVVHAPGNPIVIFGEIPDHFR
jgi:hypothetical protein